MCGGRDFIAGKFTCWRKSLPCKIPFLTSCFAQVNFRAQAPHFNGFNLFKTIPRQPSNVGVLFFHRAKEIYKMANKERFGEL